MKGHRRRRPDGYMEKVEAEAQRSWKRMWERENERENAETTEWTRETRVSDRVKVGLKRRTPRRLKRQILREDRGESVAGPGGGSKRQIRERMDSSRQREREKRWRRPGGCARE
eukprot:2570345-Pleurochrysis_carterae.AAC.1